MNWTDWIRRILDGSSSSEDPGDNNSTPQPSEIPDQTIKVETGISTSQIGKQWLKIPASYHCGPVTVDGHDAEQKTIEGMVLWYIEITKISEGKLRIACPTVTYVATISKHDSTGTSESTDDHDEHDLTESGSKPYHHYNPKAWHGAGSAIVLCPGKSVESVSIDGRELTKHGSPDKGREVWTDYHHPGLHGEVIMRAGSRVWKFSVRSEGLQHGDCWRL